MESNIIKGNFSRVKTALTAGIVLATSGAEAGIARPTKREVEIFSDHLKASDKVGGGRGGDNIRWDGPGDRRDGVSPCGYAQAPGMPYGCVVDEQGRYFVRCGGSLMQILKPQTCRERILPARLRFAMVAADGDRDFSVMIAPTVRYFKPTSLIVTGYFATATALDLDRVSLNKIEISNRVQNTSKIESTEGVDGQNAGIMASAFSSGAFNNLFDFDVAEPSLGIKVEGQIDAAAANGAVILGIHFFGLTWEALPARPGSA